MAASATSMLAGAALAGALGALGASCSPAERPGTASLLPPGPELPAFALQDHHGEPFGRDQLLGRIWVVDFIFTRCPSICPQLTRTMQRFGARWRKDPGVAFLSFTVDADFDTPERLARYAAQVAPPIPRWTLLTGDRSRIQSLCVGTFQLALSEAMDAGGDITHSSRFVLLDRQARIRGTFDALDERDLERLDDGVRALLAEAPDSPR